MSEITYFNELFPKLESQVKYVLSNSPFYKSKINLTAGRDLQTLFTKIPFTAKPDLLFDQEKTPPFGSNLSIPLSKITRVHKTSGTTNKPLMIALSDEDIKHTIEVGKRCFMSAGLTKNDMVIHCLSYNMWAGGYTDHQSLEATGACVIPFGVGNSKLLIDTILNLKPTAIHCTPSYLHKLELLLEHEFNLQPRDLNLKLGLFGAESGLQNPEFRKNIEDKWGFRARNSNYGMADVLSMFGAECDHDPSLHFFAEEKLFPELIDPETGKNVSIEKSAVGELTLTNLCKEAQPLIRYRTNDIIKIVETRKCRCGAKGFRFEVMGRSDDMFTMKGVNIFVNQIGTIVNDHLDVLSGAYQIFINKHDPIVRMVIEIEAKKNTHKSNMESKLLGEFQEKIGVTPEIRLKNEGHIPRVEGKSKKLFRNL